MNQSLLGHIAIGLSSHPENVATESLNYVLKRSAGARNAMTEFLCKIGGEMSGELSFRAQVVGEDGSIPDLIGCNSDGEECVIIEAKFWAGLTDNQPVSYVRRLNGTSARVLLFVVPELRVGLVWQELISRCKEAGIHVLLDEKVSGSLIAATVSEKHRLAIVSWKVLLSHLMHHANASNEHEAISDIAQIQGLCAVMDENAFLPMRSEELTSGVGLRYTQYCRLIDELAEHLAGEKLVTRDGLKSTGSGGTYIKYIRLVGFGCSLEVNPYLWATERETPIWLTVKDQNWALSKVVHDSLSSLSTEYPPRVIYNDNAALIPLRIPVSVDRPKVVEALLMQLREIASLLEGGRVAG